MNFDHNNPRTAGLRTTAPTNDGYRTNYSGTKRSIQVLKYNTKKRKPTESDALNAKVLVQEPAVSSFACRTYCIAAYTLIIYTITLVALVAAQTSTELTVKALLVMMLIHNCLASAVLGMSQKMNTLCDKTVGTTTTYSNFALLQHVRNDRRKNLFFLSAILSCLATIDVAYIARVATSWNDRADTFRSTGVSSTVTREMDTLSLIIFGFAVPVALLFLAELSFGLQTAHRDRQVQDAASVKMIQSNDEQVGSSDEDGPDIVSPR